MTKLTIELSDNKGNLISNIVKEQSGTIINTTTDDDDLSEEDFDRLKAAYKEALQIKDGMFKSIPISELWDKK